MATPYRVVKKEDDILEEFDATLRKAFLDNGRISHTALTNLVAAGFTTADAYWTLGIQDNPLYSQMMIGGLALRWHGLLSHCYLSLRSPLREIESCSSPSRIKGIAP